MDYLTITFGKGRKWAKILGIIFIVMFALQCFTLFTTDIVVIFGILMGVFLYLLPGLMLTKYAKAVEMTENGNDPIGNLEEACINQGKFFQFIGITVTTILVLMVVAILLILIFGISFSGY